MAQLHVVFFPLMAPGHMIPTLDVAKLFATRGVKSTIITTPLNACYFTKSVERTNQLGFQMGILTVDFPAAAAGLPEGCESVDQITSDDMSPNFSKATTLLQDPLERILDEVRPDCLVADMFFPWATEAAAKFGIPRLVFHGTSFFALCATENMRLYKPHREVSSDDEPFFVPNLPHQIKLTKMQLPEHERSESETDFARIAASMEESEFLSFGVIANSFYELETEYADYYRDVLKRRAWHIGPLVTEILKIGVSVGALKWNTFTGNSGLMREQIGKAVRRVMVGKDAEEMRNRVKEFKEMAKKAVEECGSSHTNLSDVIQELSSYRALRC
ncbi:hypothetical protein RHSIM_Rhsim11G0162900 [Rhododendron simsii]|uniref:Uncharacterized protein n=1 Tax=Rhododendron simsii TaxID=118357 RepID=A0A834GC76_RHOSS|nr:hypothetical protein RHSIM_Rhsim11G0162900 [Rhododendron simsii]